VLNGFQVRFDGLAGASDFLNGVAAAGVALLALGVLLAVVALLGRGPAAGDDPWDGQTLEWATTSPPPVGNFATLAPVTSAEPLLDLREPMPEGAS
jgi:heme/copper-type cytochrome/quinol oxidase subunit 1